MMNEKTTTSTIKHYCADCGRLIEGEGFVYGLAHYCDDCVVTCYECGAIIPREYTRYCASNDELYCEDCAEDVLFYCEYCNEYALADGASEVIVNSRGLVEYWCERCVDDYATRCEDCGALFYDDLIHTVERGRQVCDECFNDYCYCEECGRYVHCDNYDGDSDTCCDCAEENKIHRYHHTPKNKKIGEYKKQWRSIWRGLGVELEIDRENANAHNEKMLVDELASIAGDAVVFERDGSLRYGFEIITQPHTEDAMSAFPWCDVLDACKRYGYTSHDNGRCGLHIHLSREMFGSTLREQENNIAKMLLFYDCYYNEIVRFSRRDLRDALHWAGNYGIATKKCALEIARYDAYNLSRYKAVNLTNAHTVEIRIMRGTLNVDTFNACLDFVVRVAKNARKIKWADVHDVSKWLNGLKAKTREQITARNAFEGMVI